MSGISTTELRPGLSLAWGAATHVGNVRRINEDAYLTEPGIYCVADGMGGHDAGDVASRLAIETLGEAAPELPLGLDGVYELVQAANARVHAHAANTGRDRMGTTLVGLCLVDNGGEDALAVFHVGDSRCYQLTEDTGLTQLTRDHSVVQELVDQGELTEELASNHPDRSVVTRAVGVEPHVAADYRVLARIPHARLLLCSDGVSGELTDDELAELLRATDSPDQVADAIVGRVAAGPARDNATAVVVDVTWEFPPAGADDQAVSTGPRRRASPAQPLIDEVPGVPQSRPKPVPVELVDDVPHE